VSYFAHGATLALAWFVVINALASTAVLAASVRAPRSASSLLALRLLPAVLSIVFVTAVFLPSYWAFEPRDLVEGFDVTLTLLAVAGALLVASAAIRGMQAWMRARWRARVWTKAAAAVAIDGCDTPAFAVDTPEPMMALVGVLRPRLIVTRGLMDALTPEEIAAGAAHEAAHGRARDNLARLAMRAAPDVLRWTGAARRIEQRWASAAEYRADAASSAGSRGTRFALASALIKAARLMPAAPAAIEPISTLVCGGEIAVRVERLIDDAQAAGAASRRRLRARWIVAAAVAAVAFVAIYVPLLEAIHGATEILVHRLP
jgi:Zn-dependent protease with chaperone function